MKTLFKKIILELGKNLSTDWLNELSKIKLIVPLFHIITDRNAPHIKHLYKVKTINQFNNDLEYLLKFYNPISYDDFSTSLNHKRGNKPSMLLTFDDGLKEFYTIISPILIRKGIPAICFLNSDFIDNKSLFYRYKVSLLIETIQTKNLHRKILSEFPSVFNGKTSIKDTMLALKYMDRFLLDKIANVIGFNFASYLQIEQPYLNSIQIKELIKQGFHFGAHSLDHPRFSEISLQNQILQTKNSIETICNQFNLHYKAFAFPFSDRGVKDDFYFEIYKNIADFSFGTSGLKIDRFARNIHRVSFENINYNTKTIINSEIIKTMMWSLMGKNKIIYE